MNDSVYFPLFCTVFGPFAVIRLLLVLALAGERTEVLSAIER